MQESANMESSLLERLSKPGHYTLFAPTNKAFEQMENGVLQRILSDNTVLQGKGLAYWQIQTLTLGSYQ